MFLIMCKTWQQLLILFTRASINLRNLSSKFLQSCVDVVTVREQIIEEKCSRFVLVWRHL